MMQQPNNNSFLAGKRFWLVLCMLVSLVVLFSNANNGWVNWDDETFVLENELVDDLSLENTKQIFSSIDENGGYTPLVLLSWSIDHAIDGYNPTVFHTTNLALHLINVWLVFTLLFLLTGRLDVTVIATLLFGIHPMQLEAVAWITARKDLLYGLFYLAGLVAYLKYLAFEGKRRTRMYVLCILLFIAALLSKGVAVTFPLALLLLDFVKRRKDVRKALLEKVPFFLLSIGVGLIAVAGQQQGGAVDELQNISFIDSFFVACYGFVTYIIKAIAPFHLSSYHPYPYVPGQALPWYLYASAIPALAVVVITYFALKKHRLVAFGLLFFTCSVALVLQFFPVGLAIISERFVYIGYVGLFLLMALGISQLATKFEPKRMLIYGLSAGYLLLLGAFTFQRSAVWENSETLWSDVIEKYPNDFLAYINRADYYTSIGRDDLALADLNVSLQENASSLQSHIDRGIANIEQGKLEAALEDFNAAILLDPTYANGYLNRGLVLMNLGQQERAMSDFNHVIQHDESNALAYSNRGLLHLSLQQTELAIADFSSALVIDPNNAFNRLHRGDAFLRVGNRDAAKSDYERCVQLDSTMLEAHFALGSLYLQEQNFEQATSHFEQCVLLNPALAGSYINLGLIHLNLGQYNEALQELNHAILLDANNYSAYFNRGLVHHFTNNHEAAITDFNTALSLNPNYGAALNWRSVSYSKLNQTEKALEDALKAQSLGYPVDAAYLQSIGG